MKRYVTVCLVVLALLVPGTPGGATASADTSPNVRLLTKVEHPGADLEHLAFNDDLMFLQKDGGFVVYRLLKKAPYIREISEFFCEGSLIEGGISVWDDLLIQSVPEGSVPPGSGSTVQCADEGSSGKAGLRIIDISDPRRPRPVAFVETACGSHMNTLVPKGGDLYVYVSSSGGVAPYTQSAGCGEDAPTPTFQMEVVKVDLEDPSRSAVISAPPVDQTGGCYGVFVFIPRDVAVCMMGFPHSSSLRTVLLDISDPANPKTLSEISEVAYPWSLTLGAQFSWDGRYLAVTVTTNPSVWPLTCAVRAEATMGVVKLYDIEDLTNPTEVGRYTIDRTNTDQGEGCYPSRVSFIPFRNRDRMVAAIPWSGNGLSIVDFSDPSVPREIGHYYDKDPELRLAEWHNGRIYMFDQEVFHRPNHGRPWGTRDPAVVVLEMDGTKRSTTRWFKGPHNPRTQVPRMLR